jgi:hypothetical protein
VYGNGKACYWRIRVDNKNCPIDIWNGKHTTHTSDNDHTPHALIGTCSKLSAGAHTMTIYLWRSGGADCHTGWSASSDRDAFFMEAEEINPKGQFTSKMFNVGDDGRDTGEVNHVNLQFDKRMDNSHLRITWATNLRTRAHNNRGGVECYWELQIDGKSCPSPTKIGASMHSQNNDNDHIPVAIVGWCAKVKRGAHILTAYVTRNGGNADCYTGWANQDYMEVWEPTPQEMKLITYSQKLGTDNGADSSASVNSMSFKKLSAKSTIRIVYYDNLRVIGHGKWCRWEVRVDGKSCRVPIAGSLHTYNNDNDHYPHMFLGECPGKPAGTRQVAIAVTRSSGADCYTGWTPGPRVQHALIEVQEVCGKLPGCETMQSCQVGKEKCKKCRPNYNLSSDKRTCSMPVGEQSKMSAFRLTKKNSGQGGDHYSVIPGRTMSFSKGSSATAMKLTYVDNLRVYGNGKACYWRIRVDGKNCPIDIWNGKHTSHASDNDHTPHALIGSCGGLSAGSHVMSIYLWRSGGADCYTGWSASGARDAFFMEAEEINPKGQFTHKMFTVGDDGRDGGTLNGVVMNFDKRSDKTHLRITWATNLRVRAHNNKGGAECHWELRVDGQSCPAPSKIGASMHSQNNDNDHIPIAITGWCQNIKKGPHSLSVYISRNGGNTDCYTGWNNQDYMEVWEPTKAEQSKITYMQRVNTDKSSDYSNNLLSMSFVKKTQKSVMRILYYDNLRVIGSGKWCRWEVKVDGRSCKVPLAGSVHTKSGDNDHYPATILGECFGLKQGGRKLRVAVTRSSGADCHTGWTPGPKVMHALIEVQEACPKILGCAVPGSCETENSEQCKVCIPGYKLKNGKADKCIMPLGQASKVSAWRLTRKNTGQGGDAYTVIPGRTMKFKKKKSSNYMKLTYADNLRTHGNGKACYWRIRVDNKNCPIDIWNGKHTSATSDNDHTPHAIIGTCSKLSAGSHTMTIQLWRSGGADCYTGWSASGDRDAYYMEAEEINPQGQITSKMFNVGDDGRDTGTVNGVNLNFNKRSDDSQLRITWATNLRIRAHNNKGGVYCNWELRIDGKSCSTPSKIGASMHSQHNDNDHIPVAIMGWCKSIKRGPHLLTVYVSRNGGNSDCYTGWANQDYMEVWEPTPKEQSLISYQQKVGTDNGSDQKDSVLNFNFAKTSQKSVMRILYYDNLRVIGNGRWCRWEVKVDGKSCPVPLAGSLHTGNSDNDHYPHVILGECPGAGKGKHRIDIALTRSSGADCHTGWTPSPYVMHSLIEVQEVCGMLYGCESMEDCKGNVDNARCKVCGVGYVLNKKDGTCIRPVGQPSKLSAYRLTQRNSGQGGDAYSVIPGRQMSFNKISSKTAMKLTYVDNLRTHGNGKACYWRIRVDNRNCPIDIWNGKHTSHNSDNDHTPHALIGTCAKISAGTHTMTIQLWRSGGADCYTGWSASGARDAFFMEAEEINPAGQFTHKMFTVGDDGRDGGRLSGVHLKFDKRTDPGHLRITWATNLRTRAHNNRGGVVCYWELQIDGKSCTKPSKIGASMHSQNNDNDHVPIAITGWCQGIKKGPHTLSVYVSRNGGNADCYTGWANQDYMEVWEPTKEEQNKISYMQRVNTDNGSDQAASVLSSVFTKLSANSNVRILYYDNLRVIGGGKWCRWEVKVDGKSCPVSLAASVHTSSGDNDHYPATILGECPGATFEQLETMKKER